MVLVAVVGWKILRCRFLGDLGMLLHPDLLMFIWMAFIKAPLRSICVFFFLKSFAKCVGGCMLVIILEKEGRNCALDR